MKEGCKRERGKVGGRDLVLNGLDPFEILHSKIIGCCTTREPICGQTELRADRRDTM